MASHETCFNCLGVPIKACNKQMTIHSPTTIDITRERTGKRFYIVITIKGVVFSENNVCTFDVLETFARL